MKKYSDKELQGLADNDLIWPKKSSIYNKREEKELQLLKGSLDDDDPLAWVNYINNVGVNLVDEQLWWDCCEIINDLAQLVLDERHKTKKIVAELKLSLKDTITDLNKLK